MPIHSMAAYLVDNAIRIDYVVYTMIGFSLLVVLKKWAGGRVNECERDWAGKMVLVVSPPNAVTFELIHRLAHLAHPPQILYLPPIPSPLPQPLLTLLHTIKLSASTYYPKVELVHPSLNQYQQGDPNDNPDAARPKRRNIFLHCEPLPNTAEGIRSFVRMWGSKTPGTGDEGRRIDAIVWGDGWIVEKGLRMLASKTLARSTNSSSTTTGTSSSKIKWQDVLPNAAHPDTTPTWTSQESQFHLLTCLLPQLLAAPMERNIRLISLISPFFSAGIPSLFPSVTQQGKEDTPNPSLKNTIKQNVKLAEGAEASPILTSGKEGLERLLLWKHLQRVLDALASVALKEKEKAREVPVVEEGSEEGIRRRGGKAKETKTTSITTQSNILAIPVILGMHRQGIVRGLMAARGGKDAGDGSWLGYVLYFMFFPIIYLLTPSTSSTVESIMFALSAPVQYGPRKDPRAAVSDVAGGEGMVGTVGDDKKEEAGDDRTKTIGGGEIVRDCMVVDLPLPIDQVNNISQQIWESLEKSVETGVKACIEREKIVKEQKDKEAAAGGISSAGILKKEKIVESEEEGWDKVDGDEVEGDEGEKGVY